jgi:hypothetical protein
MQNIDLSIDDLYTLKQKNRYRYEKIKESTNDSEKLEIAKENFLINNFFLEEQIRKKENKQIMKHIILTFCFGIFYLIWFAFAKLKDSKAFQRKIEQISGEPYHGGL